MRGKPQPCSATHVCVLDVYISAMRARAEPRWCLSTGQNTTQCELAITLLVDLTNECSCWQSSDLQRHKHLLLVHQQNHMYICDIMCCQFEHALCCLTQVTGFNLRKWMIANSKKVPKMLEALGRLVAADKLKLEYTE